VVLNPDWDWLLEALKARLPGFRVFFVVPSEDTSIKWIRVMSGVGIMDLVRSLRSHMSLLLITLLTSLMFYTQLV